MQTLPFQPEIAERMLAGTTDEHIHPEAVFVHTANGYWGGLAPRPGRCARRHHPARHPLRLGGRRRITGRIAAMLESGEYAEIAEFDGDDEAWAQMLAGCDEDHEHNKHCGHSHK